jgi:hypothetical protein
VQGLRDEVSSLRQDPTDRSRLRERAIDKMVDAIDGAGTMVRDNAPALGTTLALLAGWSLRRPLLRAAGWLWERRPSPSVDTTKLIRRFMVTEETPTTGPTTSIVPTSPTGDTRAVEPTPSKRPVPRLPNWAAMSVRL